MGTNNNTYINKKASYEYFIIEKYTAGIVLTGTEIKSIRQGKVNFVDSYCFFKGTELWIKNLHIAEYKYGSYNNHEPKRERKLLLKKRELIKIKNKVKEKGITIIPLKLFINEKGLAKIEISLAKGKKLYDKRESIKLKEHKNILRKEKFE